MFDEEQAAIEAEVAQQERMLLEDLSPVISGNPLVAGASEGVTPDESVGVELVPVDRHLQEGGGQSGTDDEDDTPDAPVNPLDIPDHYDLPIYGSVQACIKCGLGSTEGDHVAFRTEYHSGGVLGQPCGETFGWPEVQNLGEHLCLTCTRCSYGFPMAVWRG